MFFAAECTDADLVLHIARSNPDAESELFRRMAPRIRLYGLRHLRNEAAADDLVQLVLITVLETLRAGRLREAEKLASFVLGTARMTVANIRRGAERKEFLLASYGPHLLVPQPAPSPALDHDRLHLCVQGLKERERTVIVMTFYDEKTSADLADAIGVSEANLRVIRHRAIHQLRGCLGVAA